ncbi:histone-lysine N- H3 lysine-36 and H4 lysine-20 specific isoform X1 [Brachionus plicatilis]|uniref:Histone-lysine N-H3 lysine-36 and H4 lysine-20 specific isoform X1 n=1 Tax=Brachionus plicatilis TaxID=10195 RepID=A0A3M7SGK8_BRAPC|nr:histone-lysine N- H3 lysine-36 and H4 lysine-20 specific isoform X1 [Brachionus plicatilis]
MVKHKQNKEEDIIPRVVGRPKSISSAVSSINSSISELVKDSQKKMKSNRTSTRKSLPNLKVKKRKNSDSDRDESSNEDELSDNNVPLNELEKNELIDDIDLEFAKLESPNQPFKKENICSVCEMPNFLIDCQGKCQHSFHLDCIGLSRPPSGAFLCEECQNDSHMCFLCKKSPSKENNVLTFKCSHNSCGKYFHLDCIKENRLFQKQDTNEQEFICPAHHCRTCFLELGMEKVSQASKARLIKCFRCPLSYHYGEHCPPAGSIILNSNFIICPAHFRPLKNNRGHFRLNVTWCFSCCKKDDLIGCNQCPAAYHAKCLENLNKSESLDEKESKTDPGSPASSKIKLDQLSPLSNSSSGTSNTLSSAKSHQIESNWTCEDCLLGKKPLNGQIVWAKNYTEFYKTRNEKIKIKINKSLKNFRKTLLFLLYYYLIDTYGGTLLRKISKIVFSNSEIKIRQNMVHL